MLTEVEKWRIINDSETFDQLKDNIKRLADEDGSIMGRIRPFLAEKQINNVDIVKAGYPANILTRSYGIRQQAIYLLYYHAD